MRFCGRCKGQETELILTLPLTSLVKEGFSSLPQHDKVGCVRLLPAITFHESELTKPLETKGAAKLSPQAGAYDECTSHRLVKPKFQNDGQVCLLFTIDFFEGMSLNWVL